MKKTVWKFLLRQYGPLPPTVEELTINMPAGAKVLHVGVQDSDLMLWALVDPDALPEPRNLVIAGTGHLFDLPPSGLHLGSAQTRSFVWHVFETRRA